MRLLGFDITRSEGGFEITRATKEHQNKPPGSLSSVGSSSWFGLIRESFAGAWQSSVTTDPPKSILAFSAVYSCVTGIASDISKMRPMLMQQESSGVWIEVDINSPFLPVLRKPNHFQNRIKFIQGWIISKLLHGAAYALKHRDGRGVVTALYLLDPTRVTPLVAENGDVYYRLSRDDLAGVPDGSEGQVTVPASEIIHDVMYALWHPLLGVSPIYACAVTSTMGNKIQANQTNFFANASRPGGVLVAPGEIHESTADRLKTYWEENFSGTKAGKVAVLGDGLKYEPMMMTAVDAQLIEQLKWTVEDVARAFRYPMYKLGGQAPTYNNIEALTQDYYSSCLQELIESVELSLTEGLALPDRYKIDLDVEALVRMDTQTRYKVKGQAIKDGWLAPNEARRSENYAPVPGGDSPMMQQQNWPLGQLAERDPPKGDSAPPAALPAPGSSSDEEGEEKPEEGSEEGEQNALASLIISGFEEGHHARLP